MKVQKKERVFLALVIFNTYNLTEYIYILPPEKYEVVGAPLRSKCRTLTKRNAATNEATANTSKSITRPPTKLGTDIQIVSGSAIRGLTVKSIVSRRLRTPRKSSRPSTERGRPPSDTKFPPSKSSLRFTVLYCPACPGNGGGAKGQASSDISLLGPAVNAVCGDPAGFGNETILPEDHTI
uniref:Uncharacterized protein n=1 Tax=Glossina austeni TaxID=7395 RepID=A0A1A9V475_GLOAU